MVRCKKCKVVRRNPPKSHECWGKWQLCGVCAAIEHPEEYPHWISKNNGSVWKAKRLIKKPNGREV